MIFATAIAVPMGIWLTRAPRWAKPVIAFANILQTIPSLAMFGFLLPLPWLGERAARIAILALIGYALLPFIVITHLGLILWATLKANKGDSVQYPLTLRFIS